MQEHDGFVVELPPAGGPKGLVLALLPYVLTMVALLTAGATMAVSHEALCVGTAVVQLAAVAGGLALWSRTQRLTRVRCTTTRLELTRADGLGSRRVDFTLADVTGVEVDRGCLVVHTAEQSHWLAAPRNALTDLLWLAAAIEGQRASAVEHTSDDAISEAARRALQRVTGRADEPLS